MHLLLNTVYIYVGWKMTFFSIFIPIIAINIIIYLGSRIDKDAHE